MEMIGIASVAAITVIAYLIGEGIKVTGLDNKWIPVICGICGGALGVVGMKIMPDFPATDYITAVAVGIVSGLAATALTRSLNRWAKRIIINTRRVQSKACVPTWAQTKNPCKPTKRRTDERIREKFLPLEWAEPAISKPCRHAI